MSAVRPQFDPATPEETAARQRPAILPWLRLMRLPNVFIGRANGAKMQWSFVACKSFVPRAFPCPSAMLLH
jgi:hypothetical protein